MISPLHQPTDIGLALVPLGDVAPDLVIPGVGRVADLASRLGDRGLERWPD